MTILILYALAAFWVWFIIARTRPPLVWRVGAALRRLPRGDDLVGCPWCLGFWVSLVVVLAGDFEVSWETPFRVAAVAALVGLTGTLLPDDGEPT